ncbi:MAG: M20 family metallo-hydrolase [Methyloligellaceae bacterium]
MPANTLPKINADRVWERHMEMAKIGATPGGGVHRLALTAEDIAAHRLLAEWAAARSFAVEIDAMGNMFIRRPGSDPSLAAAASGSHTDTQPNGGRFDGIFGVLAAFEALEAIDEAGLETRRPLEAIIWNNEEGARFVPGCSGSAVYAGTMALDDMLDCRDRDGVTMRACVDALHAALPEAGTRDLGQPLAAFIEAHIEQGPELEANGNAIGVVSGMQGNRRFRVDVTGEDAHSGTTPRVGRKDALVAATDMAVALREVFWDDEDVVRFTIGQFDVLPGAKSVVPGRASFTIDFRHPSAEILRELGDQVAPVCAAHAGPCAVETHQISSAAPVDFPEAMVSRIAAAAERRGFSSQPIYSGAGHDARYLASLCPAGMIFIPCWRGISHNEAERAEPGDVAAGAQVIADVLTELANSSP